MLSRITRLVSSNNISKINNVRNLCWMKNNNGIYSIGLTNETVYNYEGINSININNNYFVKFNDELCFIESEKFVESLIAPFDCKIVEKNKKILETINIDPENQEYSWIVKIEPVIWGNSLNISITQSLNNYFNNYRNTQGIPAFNIAHV